MILFRKAAGKDRAGNAAKLLGGTKELSGNDALCAGSGSNMAMLQVLKAQIEQRLSAAVADIFSRLENTIAEYEEKLQQNKLLEAFLNPRVVLHRIGE